VAGAGAARAADHAQLPLTGRTERQPRVFYTARL
jgi:hypothetical protein